MDKYISFFVLFYRWLKKLSVDSFGIRVTGLRVGNGEFVIGRAQVKENDFCTTILNCLEQMLKSITNITSIGHWQTN